MYDGATAAILYLSFNVVLSKYCIDGWFSKLQCDVGVVRREEEGVARRVIDLNG